MTVAAIIPARYGSTRLEGKVLKSIGGKPMVQWVYERAASSILVGDLMVATDDERVEEAVKAFGGNVVMTSRDHPSGTDRVAEAAGFLGAEIILNLQGDEPLITPEVIDEALRPMIDDSTLKISTLKTPISSVSEFRDPNAVKVVTDSEGFALYFSREPIPHNRGGGGGLPNAYKHIGIYAYRRDFLLEYASLIPTPLESSECLEQLRVLENGYRIKVVEVPYSPLSVDTEEDLEEVRGVIEGGKV